MIELPASVQSYLTDTDVMTAVDTLLSGKEKLAPGLQWDEMEAYYAAVRAAQQVKADYAVALHRLWVAAWGEAVAGLKAVSPDDAEDNKYANTVHGCWNSFSYGRPFELSSDRWLWTEVWMNDKQTSVLAAIDGMKQRAMLMALPGFGKCDVPNWVSFDAEALLGGTDPLPVLRGAAVTAVNAARASLAG